MEKNRGTKIIAIIALCIAVAGISLAYAAMSTTLTIKGSATMDTAKWDIKFTSLNTSKTGAATIETAPQIVGDITIEEYDVTLTKPGDSIVIDFTVSNEGTLDADLSEVVIGTLDCGETTDGTLVCENLDYTLVYAEDTDAAATGTALTKGTAVADGQKLLQGQSVDMTLTLAYKASATELPADDVEITVGATTLYYEQAADAAE